MKSVGLAVFAYDRPEHLERCLQSLMACPEFDLFAVTVFCDGPKTEASGGAVRQTVDVARRLLGDRADIRQSVVNKGLARSIIGGVTELVERFGRVVVVEDDLIVSPVFLRYMLDALDRYQDDERVFQVSGHQFAVPEFEGRDESMLLPMTTTWGWGTWARAWAQFDPAATGWQKLRSDRTLRRRFNLDGAYDYSAMLERQMEGKRDSWGVRWNWTVFCLGGTTLFPARSLVQNIGADGSGTHGRGWVARISGQGQRQPLAKAYVLPVIDEVEARNIRNVHRAIKRQTGGFLKQLSDGIRMIFRF